MKYARRIVRLSNGETYQSLKEACRIKGVNYNTCISRINKGETVESALSKSDRRCSPSDDKTGHSFPSKKAMCQYHKVNYNAYLTRSRNGESVVQALRPRKTAKHDQQATDHLGKTFKNEKKMCEYHKVNYATYLHRIKAGKTLAEALSPVKSKRRSQPKKILDPFGNYFPTLIDMCNYHNVSYVTYHRRIKEGKSMAEALKRSNRRSSPPKSKRGRTDHLGNQYSSVEELCNHYNITYAVYYNRQQLGWDLERILTTPCQPKNKVSTDHLGTVYQTEQEMCAHYNIEPRLFQKRMKSGSWTLKEALTTPPGARCKRGDIADGFGNVFLNYSELCRYHNIDEARFRSWRRKGLSVKDAINKSKHNHRSKAVPDHKGNIFASFAEMAAHYNLDRDTLYQRLKNGWALEDALETPKRKFEKEV